MTGLIMWYDQKLLLKAVKLYHKFYLFEKLFMHLIYYTRVSIARLAFFAIFKNYTNFRSNYFPYL